MGKLLSETETGRKWISNFGKSEQILAKKLLNKLRIIDTGTFRFGLEGCLERLLKEQQIESPVLLVGALSLEDIKAAHPSIQSKNEPFEMFRNCYPNDSLNSAPGSEAEIANLIRDITRKSNRSQRNRWIAQSSISSIADLRQKKCKTIAILTDISSSGQQLLEYAKCWTRNPTIRSWRSLHNIRIVGVAFAYSINAYEKAKSPNSPIDSLYGVEVIRTFDTCGWDSLEQDVIRQFCKNTTPKKHMPEALGYRGSESLFVIEPNVPNNLPWILRPCGNKKNGEKWIPFFDHRTFPESLWKEMQSGSASSAIPSPREVLGEGFKDYSRILNSSTRATRPKVNRLILLLAFIRAGLDIKELSARMSLPIADIESSFKTLRCMGLINDKDKLTNLGQLEYRECLRRKNRDKRFNGYPQEAFEKTIESYYPQKLR